MKGPIPGKEPPKTPDEVFAAIGRLHKYNSEAIMTGATKLFRRVTKQAIADHLDCETEDIDKALYNLQDNDWIIKNFTTNEYEVKR